MAEKKLTVRNIDKEIKKRSKKDEWKGTDKEIDTAKKFVEKIKKQNSKTRYEVKKLKQEQVSKGTTQERVKEIDKELKLPKYKTISLKGEKNYIDMLEGKDFYHVIDNGFSVYKIKDSKLEKSENIGLELVNKILEDMLTIEADLKEKLKNKYLDKTDRKKYKSMLKGISKLYNITVKNQEALEEDDFEELDKDEQSYPLLVMILGDTIRVNA